METVSRNFDCLKFFLVANGRLATANLENYLEYGPWCSRRRRIDEADINTPVPVDRRFAICLEEAVRSFCVGWYTASKLASLWNCSSADELLLRDRIILLLEGR